MQSIKTPIAAIKPTHLILNSGLWGSSNVIGVRPGAWQPPARRLLLWLHVG
jgi:hypothetical protein